MRAFVVVSGFLVLLTSGCGGGGGDVSYARVTGTVTLDGKAVEGATVTFTPKGKGAISMGLTDADGRFDLKTATGKTGAVVGEHDVMVTHSMTLGAPAVEAKPDDLAPALDEAGNSPKSSGPQTRWIVPEKYSKPGVLNATVPAAGLSDHKLDLTSK